jgi:restriction system protein
MTIVESIKCVLQQNNDGLTSKQIYDEIIRQGLYSFGAENPVGVVNAQLRRRCIGLDFPTAYPIKFFEIAGYEGKKIKFRLISTENTATIITAPKTTDIAQRVNLGTYQRQKTL